MCPWNKPERGASTRTCAASDMCCALARLSVPPPHCAELQTNHHGQGMSARCCNTSVSTCAALRWLSALPPELLPYYMATAPASASWPAAPGRSHHLYLSLLQHSCDAVCQCLLLLLLHILVQGLGQVIRVEDVQASLEVRRDKVLNTGLETHTQHTQSLHSDFSTWQRAAQHMTPADRRRTMGTTASRVHQSGESFVIHRTLLSVLYEGDAPYVGNILFDG
jgi:hypothetical protein